ncbi:MAG TPA: hypothetical protein VLU99_02050 [Nitrososphaerales archaeon]|nr:hypothetical protein [Nitrososphaerales archaeon]
MKPAPPPMGLGEIGDPVVASAVEALNARDSGRWYALFADGARFSDDGVARDLMKWCDEELFGRYRAYITSIDKVEGGGMTFYARYHSDKWGDFKTFWKFRVEGGKVASLDVGATSY